MVCPFYKNGLCTSPLVGEPRADVYIKGKCDGDESRYTKCKYYVKQSNNEDQIDPGSFLQKFKPDPLYNILRYEPKSDCNYFKVYKTRGGNVAYCEILKRLLTKYEVELCIKSYEKCPLRKMLAFSAP